MRDIEKYTIDYSENGFEVIQEMYRRKKLLEILKKYNPKNILDIGCGMKPIFTEMNCIDYEKYTCIEPSINFYKNATVMASDNKRVECINDFYPSKKLQNIKYDFIICSSLLHEIEDQPAFIKAIFENCTSSTKVYFCVPNANSFHRIIAQRMGVIKELKEITERNKRLQQHNVFDFESLKQLLEENRFSITESGSFFMKPFTHKQMYTALTEGIIDESVLDGLYNCSIDFPDNGSELYIVAEVQ